MKAEIKIYQCAGVYFAEIEIQHDFLASKQILISRSHISKGQVKRKAIQFANQLGLDYEMVVV